VRGGNLKPSHYLELPRLEVGSPIPFNTSSIHLVWVPQHIIQTQNPLPLPPHSSNPLKERGNKKKSSKCGTPAAASKNKEKMGPPHPSPFRLDLWCPKESMYS